MYLQYEYIPENCHGQDVTPFTHGGLTINDLGAEEKSERLSPKSSHHEESDRIDVTSFTHFMPFL